MPIKQTVQDLQVKRMENEFDYYMMALCRKGLTKSKRNDLLAAFVEIGTVIQSGLSASARSRIYARMRKQWDNHTFVQALIDGLTGHPCKL